MSEPTDGESSKGLKHGITAGLRGEQVSFKRILMSIGGVPGIVEALLPGLLFLGFYLVTEDVKISVIGPVVVIVLSISYRLLRKQTLVSALSGMFGVGIAVAATLLTGRGEDYFLPGFWINGVWAVALIVSLLVGYPLVGFIAGTVTGDLRSWRNSPAIYSASKLATLAWVVMFLLRLAIQLPLYFAGNIAALGLFRVVMGTPLFAILIVFTWLLFKNTSLQTNEEQEN